MTEDGPEPRDLAAEYALGALDAQERIEARRRIASDPAFAAEVAAWEERLSPLAAAYGEQSAPGRVLAAAEARLFGEAAPAPAPRFGLRFWRGLAFASLAALAVSLGANALRLAGPPAGATLVISLDAADGAAANAARFLALYRPGEGEVRLRAVAGEAAAGRDFQLWLIEGTGAPVSLGVLPRSGEARIELPAALAQRLREEATLAVSLEPEGGSPTGQPTGPVVAAGVARSL